MVALTLPLLSTGDADVHTLSGVAVSDVAPLGDELQLAPWEAVDCGGPLAQTTLRRVQRVTIGAESDRFEQRGQHVRNMETKADASPEQLLDELVREHLDAVYRVAFSVVRDSALAEDVAQDAILKAWRALPTFRGESSLRSWVLRITHNTAISTLRKRREELRDPALLPEQESRSSTEAEAVGRLSIDAFEEALDQLDELSRSIIVLREVEGLSYDEIADMLGVPLPTVKTRLLRGRRVLASALTDWKP